MTVQAAANLPVEHKAAASDSTLELQVVSALLTRVLRDSHRILYGNVDWLRFPEEVGFLRGAPRDYLWGWALDLKRAFTGWRAQGEANQLTEMLMHVGDIARLYGRLSDPACRETLISVLEFRVLGYRRVKLALAQGGAYARAAARAKSLVRQWKTFAVPEPLRWLNFYDLSPLGYDVKLHAHPLNVISAYLLEQYRCQRVRGDEVKSLEGGVVLDGGGCFGDTALYFAHQVGPRGRVLTFEFEPSNIVHMQRNLELNPSLGQRVSLIQRPLWENAGQAVSMSGDGPGTTINAESRGSVMTTTVDATVSAEGLERVDLIKFDIEGAELAALHGAEATLRRFRPTLAMSVYHRLRDFWEIADYIDGLKLGYRFYLDHFTIHSEETVLFALPPTENSSVASS